MREDAIVRFLLALGVGRNELKQRNSWVNTKCVLAPYLHSGGEDKHPSFGVSISDDGPSIFLCFGCFPKGGRLGKLLHLLWLMTGKYPSEAAKIYALEENHGVKEPMPVPDPWTVEEKKAVPLPPIVLREYPLLQGASGYEARRCREFLRGRGIPVWAQNYGEVRYSEHEQAVVFPLTDFDGNVMVLRVRSRKAKKIWTVSNKIDTFKDVEFPTLKKSGAWYGLHLVDWDSPVTVVEGELDRLRLIVLGNFNVLASATSSVAEAQLSALAANTLVLGYDSDKAGAAAHARIIEKMAGGANIFLLDWSVAKRKDGRRCKDAGDIPDLVQLESVLSSMKMRGQ